MAKRLIDYGFHSPTSYFPLTVHEALMIEPTETEAKPMLDAFISAIHGIAQEARDSPGLLRSAPHVTPTGRLDKVKAARQLILNERAPPTTH
jgi:glycine dehydrogenase subunit 2